MGLTVEITFDAKALGERLHRKIDAAQKALTIESKKEADVYTPEDDGRLKNDYTYTTNERGIEDGWRYNVPYSRRQWFGTRKDGKPYVYSQIANNKARRRWTMTAASSGKDAIIKAVKRAFENA